VGYDDNALICGRFSVSVQALYRLFINEKKILGQAGANRGSFSIWKTTGQGTKI
jgi:hypothetical protein